MEPVSDIDKDCIVSLMSPVLKGDRKFCKFPIRPVSKETCHNIDTSHKRGRALSQRRFAGLQNLPGFNPLCHC